MPDAIAANNFEKFYHADSSAPTRPYSKHEHTDDVPIYGLNPTSDTTMLRRNYTRIGWTGFLTTEGVKTKDLQKHAKKVGADVVCFRSDYVDTVSGTTMTLHYEPPPAPIVAETRGSVGFTNYRERTVIRSTNTVGTLIPIEVPYTAARTQYFAHFYRRGLPPVVGTIVGPLPQELRTKLQRNTGLHVGVLLDDSPAFNAGILENDVIVAIDGKDINGPAEWDGVRAAIAGRTVPFKIQRGDKELTINVTCNPVPETPAPPKVEKQDSNSSAAPSRYRR